LIEEFVDTNFPTEEWPELRIGQVLTALMYSGVQNPEAAKVVTDYITNNGPNSKVSKAARMVEDLTPEEKAALIKKLGLDV
jgi:hypothetical protein